VSEGQTKSGREGNLEAPTRHALGWQKPQFYDAEALQKELDRLLDICHGCRRCFNLWQFLSDTVRVDRRVEER